MNRKMEISYRVREQVYRYIVDRKLINKGDTVIAGVSGGADSVCLLFLLKELMPRLEFDLSVLHVEHGIRGDASLEDARFVEDLCRKEGIPFQCRQVDAGSYAKEKDLSLEEAARTLRYEAFAKACTEKGASCKIAVAHHMEDQAETVLFQMARGSGIRGLGGIRPVRDNIIRPLLTCSRQDLLLYLKEKQISYRLDETNTDNRFARNRIRNQTLPELNDLQPSATRHIANAAEELQEIENYIRKQADIVYPGIVSEDGTVTRIDTKGFLELDHVLRNAVVKIAIEAFVPGRKDILRRHIDGVCGLAGGESGKELHLPGGLVAQKQGQYLLIHSRRNGGIPEEGPWILYDDAAVEWNDEGDFALEGGRVLQKSVFAYDPAYGIVGDTYTKWLDYDRIKNGLQIRTRRNSDFLYIDEAGHKQKLQDYFVNCKIPAGIRDRLVLIASGDHILWIPGYRISSGCKITEQTKRILELRIRGGFPWKKE